MISEVFEKRKIKRNIVNSKILGFFRNYKLYESNNTILKIGTFWVKTDRWRHWLLKMRFFRSEVFSLEIYMIKNCFICLIKFSEGGIKIQEDGVCLFFCFLKISFSKIISNRSLVNFKMSWFCVPVGKIEVFHFNFILQSSQTVEFYKFK